LIKAVLARVDHPIPYDDEYAKTTRFGKRVAHRLLLTALTAVGASTLFSLLEGSMAVFVEQSARFLMKCPQISSTVLDVLYCKIIDKADRGIVPWLA
jgi:hypothetical protein